MPVLLQIAAGSFVLLGCSILHIRVISMVIERLRKTGKMHNFFLRNRVFSLTVLLILILLASHTIQVYAWAITLWFVGALDGYEEPIYFALVSYTTLGYGDVTLDAGHRILGAMSSVNGILAFGLTTAFLVGYFSRAFMPTLQNDDAERR